MPIEKEKQVSSRLTSKQSSMHSKFRKSDVQINKPEQSETLSAENDKPH